MDKKDALNGLLKDYSSRAKITPALANRLKKYANALGISVADVFDVVGMPENYLDKTQSK